MRSPSPPRLLALLLALAGLLPARSARAQDDLVTLLERMGGSDTTLRYPAYQELSRRREPAALPPLLERIGGWDLSAQSYGLSLIDVVGGEPAAKAWKQLAATARAPYLKGSAGARVHATDPTKGSRLVVEALEAARADGLMLSWILSRLGGLKDAAVATSVRGLLGPTSGPEILGPALSYLALVNDAQSPALVRALVKAPEAGTRALAAAWLLRAGEEEQAGVLAAALASGEVSLSEFLRLKPWLEAADRVPEVVLAALLAGLEKESNTSQVVAEIELLGRARHAPALPALRRLLDSTEPLVAKAAFEALAAMPGGLEGDALAAQLKHADPARRLAAAEALRRADDQSGLPVVVELARAGSPERREAVRVLSGFRVAEATLPLIDALLDDDVTTRAYAYNGLADLLAMLFPYRRLDLGSTGYATDAAPEARRAAVERLRAWWQAHKDRPW